MIRLSLCMITRDEEAMLPGCLASVRGVVDEIVIVDTGSVDATIAIARAATARVVEVPWQDDFAFARNASIAAATGDWILILDADERLAPGAGAAIRAALESARFDCGMLPLHNATRADSAPADVVRGTARLGEPRSLPRLLRREGELRFTGRVHESVIDWLRARGMRLAFVDADIVHLGSTAEIRAHRGKAERNIALLEALVAERPRDVTAHGYLAHELLERGRVDDARAVVARGWALLEGGDAGDASALHLATTRARIGLADRDAATVLATCALAERHEGPHPDLDFLRGAALEMQAPAAPSAAARDELLEAALAAYRAALAKRGQRYAETFVEGAMSWASATRAGAALLQLARPVEARACFAAALAAKPDHREARLGALECQLDQGEPRAVLGAVEPLLDDRPDAWLLTAAALHALGLHRDCATFLAQARARADGGFLSPHRRERHVALHLALASALGITPGLAQTA
jgi:glycosyltransferase involved in cell wall biosynthesis